MNFGVSYLGRIPVNGPVEPGKGGEKLALILKSLLGGGLVLEKLTNGPSDTSFPKLKFPKEVWEVSFKIMAQIILYSF